MYTNRVNGPRLQISVVDNGGVPAVGSGSGKRLAVGRLGADEVLVMPDQRTLYITGGAGGGLFKFVATAAGDLSSGEKRQLSRSDDGTTCSCCVPLPASSHCRSCTFG